MRKAKELTILAVETSCDDTAISLVRVSEKKEAVFKILSNIVSSQTKIHEKWGGVYPSLAKREHQKNLTPVLEKALKKAGMLKKSQALTADNQQSPKSQNLKKILEREEKLYKNLWVFLKKYRKPQIDLIAITNGPGLEPCLWVGINFIKALAYYWELPVITVNHIKAHIFVNNLKFKKGLLEKKLDFPAVCLIVSGGHTQLFLMKDYGKYELLGETRDDAAGECFDKTARILGLGYPGGPAIAKAASQWKSQTPAPNNQPSRKSRIKLPRPMINTKDYDFSFSGLKTAVLYKTKTDEKKAKNKNYVKEMAFEIEQSITDILVKKTIKAARDFNAKMILIGGGVAANEELREKLLKNCKLKIESCRVLIPPTELCTDNAVMTAIAGYFRHRQGKKENWKDIKAEANLKI